MRIAEIASSAEYRMGEQFQNLTIFRVKFWFSKLEKKSINFPIFHFGKLQKFPKFYTFENHQIYTIEKFIKLSNFWNYSIFKIGKLLNYQNFKNPQLDKLSYMYFKWPNNLHKLKN